MALLEPGFSHTFFFRGNEVTSRLWETFFGARVCRKSLPLARWVNFVQVCACLLLFTFIPSTVAQSPAPNPEYKLKAVYLFNFVQYVEWPQSAFADADSPLIIGVLGADPFGKTLDDTVAGEVIHGRKLEVHRYQHVGQIKECHVLYISASEKAKWKSILARLKGRSILLVSDMEDFAVNGGTIRFIMEKNKIRFRINVDSAKAANLSISSKLLQLSDLVPKEKR